MREQIIFLTHQIQWADGTLCSPEGAVMKSPGPVPPFRTLYWNRSLDAQVVL